MVVLKAQLIVLYIKEIKLHVLHLLQMDKNVGQIVIQKHLVVLDNVQIIQ